MRFNVNARPFRTPTHDTGVSEIIAESCSGMHQDAMLPMSIVIALLCAARRAV